MEKARLDQSWATTPAAVLFDRDGTLVHDVPYNRDPQMVSPVPGASEALGRLRAAGVRTGVVTNQSGIGRGLMGSVDVYRVNRRVDELLGPFDVWRVCPHHPEQGCRCRKPRPGLVLSACRALRVAPEDVVVVGDIGTDMEAAGRAGARGILVPTPVTLPEEVEAAPAVAPDLLSAVMLALGESVESAPAGNGP
ncbi:D-glycero-alpha-D-manno-heptose-1,7-bisphosphate 7-phosphatase [Sinomonas susongensis]|uniref:D-glycero-alpha-D-manno-heptose-1,7-bisphosphate 7-phosphatase n=1 Tax=Sinomonas susongensis TaxID=1324851 RepID=UPI0011087CEC|nr:HAD family hydrolase [Sinomonas susongensis]